jgi:glycine betaine/proline transport system ATP-binding protein
MDEPFSALDPLIRGHLQDELLDLQRKLQKTIVFVSHDLDEALKIGNRIVIMESGRIVQVGRPEEIVTAPADDYVAAFVAHVNPLNVLRGETLMRPAAALARLQDGRVSIDARAGLDCTLDAAGCPSAVLGHGRPVRLRRDEGNGEAAFAEDECACGPVGLPMRRAIELRHATRRPVLLLDAEGRLAGVIGEEEITRGILRRHA